MGDEIVIPIVNLPLRLYFFFHFLGYASFFLVGLALRRRPSERPHLMLLTLALIISDTLLARLAAVIILQGMRAVIDWSSWSFLRPPFWGGPIFFGGFCFAYFVMRRVFSKRRTKITNTVSSSNLSKLGPRDRLADPADSRLLDAICIGWCVAYVFFKLACFARGCCGGVPSELPWCRWFNGHHPLQIYEMTAHATIAAILWALFRRGHLQGSLVLVTGACVGLTRFVLDGLQVNPGYHIGPFTLTQLIAGAVGGVCALWLAALVIRRAIKRIRRRSSPSSRPTHRATAFPATPTTPVASIKQSSTGQR